MGVMQVVLKLTRSRRSSYTDAFSSRHYGSARTPTKVCRKVTQARKTVAFSRLPSPPKIPNFANGEIRCHPVTSCIYEICALQILRFSEKLASAESAFLNHIVARESFINRAYEFSFVC